MSVLDKINTSSDLKKLNLADLKTLCAELREKIISVAEENGGHLSANLGVVEATVALHYVFDLPEDKLIFDVGHQCYAHKILSGRKDVFSSIRLEGGLSGFPDAKESEYDAFTTGHAGTSVSVGLGKCFSRDLLKEDYRVIDFVGDGSLVNGLNLEALTSSEEKPKNFLLVLNDNEMSISKNNNGLYRIISRGTTKKSYIESKRFFKKIFGESFITRFFRYFKERLKRLLNGNDYFENFGFKYVGVVDGNDLSEMVKVLSRVKLLMKDKAVFLHVKTKKGKGYADAEKSSDIFHGVGKNLCHTLSAYSASLGEELNRLIDKDNKIVAITAGMKDGTGLSVVEKVHPDNFIDVGIAEEYAVTLAAGMASAGLKPVVAVYSTFLQRAYDEILHDVCLSRLPVVFCVDRAGFVGADGKTHQGLFDLSYTSHIPNLYVFAPSFKAEFSAIIEYALSLGSPSLIRYPSEEATDEREVLPLTVSLWEKLVDGEDLSVLAVGQRSIDIALALSKTIEAKTGKKVSVINARTVCPLDETMLLSMKDKPIVTIEENCVFGGFGSAVNTFFAGKGIVARVMPYGAPKEFIVQGNVKNQMEYAGLTPEKIFSDLETKMGKFLWTEN